MNIEIVNILKKYGCAYMETDNKEMLEEIENFVNKQEAAISDTRCCETFYCYENLANGKEKCSNECADCAD
jgi:tRNA G46 methylase TrmB